MRKQISLTVNHEDVAKLLQTGVSRALERNQHKREALFEGIVPALENNDRAEVTKIFLDLIHTDEALKEELGFLVPLLEVLGDDSVPPQTEVFEDLPDLEEDGLGIDSGSE